MMSKIDDLAGVLYVKFQQEFPLAEGRGTAKAIKNMSNKNVEQRLHQYYKDAAEVRRKHGLWVIGWARVVMKLQQQLLQAGYPPEAVSKLLLAMIFSSHKAG